MIPLTPGEIGLPGYHTLGRFRKIPITRRNLNQNQKKFNPLVSDPGRFEWWKYGGQTSCWTVPLNHHHHQGMNPLLAQLITSYTVQILRAVLNKHSSILPHNQIIFESQTPPPPPLQLLNWSGDEFSVSPSLSLSLSPTPLLVAKSDRQKAERDSQITFQVPALSHHHHHPIWGCQLTVFWNVAWWVFLRIKRLMKRPRLLFKNLRKL